MAPNELTALQADVLREVTNVGAGHAATALAQLAGVRIAIDVPRIWIAPLAEIVARTAPSGGRVVVVSMRVLGDLAGLILFIMPEDRAAALLDILLHRAPGTGSVDGEMERSGLQETGNILGSSFLNAIARWLGSILVPSVPKIAVDTSDAVSRQMFGSESGAVLAVETAFLLGESAARGRLTGVFVFQLEGPSLDTILKALRVS